MAAEQVALPAGETVRVRGEGGNIVSMVVGEIFDERTIRNRLDAGAWKLVEDEAVEKPLDKMKVDELKAYATEHNIDLGDASKKPEIFAAIEAALAARAEQAEREADANAAAARAELEQANTEA